MDENYEDSAKLSFIKIKTRIAYNLQQMTGSHYSENVRASQKRSGLVSKVLITIIKLGYRYKHILKATHKTERVAKVMLALINRRLTKDL